MTIKISHINVLPSEVSIIETKWKMLEVRAENSIFLSWLWMKNWLQMIAQPVHLIEAKVDNNTVGLALFVETSREVFGCVPITQWQLHRTGNQGDDQVWIEHNDFLLDTQYAIDARSAMVSYLAHSKITSHVKEFVIGLSNNDVNTAFSRELPLVTNLVNTQGFAVNLSSLESNYCTEALSKNTRSQINRSIKLLSEQGDVTYRVEKSPNECEQLLTKISSIHKERWQQTAEGSGFSNEKFLTFHQNLIRSEQVCAEISVLALDGKDIGFLVNYICGKHISFYLSALELSTDNRIKVGLVLHSKAIQYYLLKGFEVYDFLGGYSQYKKSLANQSYELNLCTFSNKTRLLSVEIALKKLKRYLFKQ